MKTAIVCEGGGMRGVFTAGVLERFMEVGFVANMLVGVSAGASNGASYVSGQRGRGYRTNIYYSEDKRYASVESFLRTGSYFGMDFIFGTIPEKLDPFDFEAFTASPTSYYAGVTDVETGRSVWFGKEDITPGFYAVRASCSIPVLSPPVPFKGGLYLDGGTSNPIPIDKPLRHGCDKLIVILTRPRGYQKKPMDFRPLYHAALHKYPHLVKTMDLRHHIYNHTLQKLWRLEAAGRAVVIAPPAGMEVDRFGKNRQQLVEAYNTGYVCGKAALDDL